MRSKIKQLIQESLEEIKREKKLKDFVIPEISLTHPRQEKYGDWSTSIAMELAPRLNMYSMDLGKLLLKIMNKKIVQYNLAKIDLIKPGFINFYVTKDYLYKELEDLLKEEDAYGRPEKIKKKKIMVEFISANPTGPLTLGNARGGFMGDVIARVLDFVGHDVHREYYINDTGKQIEALGHSVLKDKEAVYKGDYIDDLHKRNKLKDPACSESVEPIKVGEWAAKIIVEEIIKKTIKRMNIHFDTWFSEKSLQKQGKVQEIIDDFEKKGYIYKKDNALWFRVSRFDYGHKKSRKDCVLKKRDGEFTYLASDIVYHKNKFIERKFDKVINIWGADHYGDVPRLQAGVDALGVNVKKKLRFIIVQFVRLIERGKEVRMSKRKGMYITIDDLLDEIPLDVAKFFFLMHNSDSHMDFDLTLARETSETNPVYYVQYAHARICSIVKKAPKFDSTNLDLSFFQHPSELSLIKSLVRFPEIIEEVNQTYEVHRLPYYATNLAERFHIFYKECRVIGENVKLSQARLTLVKTTKIVLKNTLDLMGISAPEKM